MVIRKVQKFIESDLSADDIVSRLLEQKDKDGVAERHSTSEEVDEEDEELEGW